MPTVRDVLARKGAAVHSIEPDATVLEATRKMNQHQLGALLVMTGERVAGIFTERDVLRRVVAEQRDPASTSVESVMTTNVICVEPDSDIDEVSSIMQQQKIRHLPVCDDGKLMGMVSIGDVNAYHATHQEAQLTFLNDYIYGWA
jgi:CBS domain-containing protein